ncbi:hypothetical protein HK103_003096 [Boothiomyces macroporosus]|uniref:Ciliary microtubule inner protein 2A-C-like domain-containing protein n=1 Tax=Boothiomyces macroporosus TaxID=261099 RepID=A0AAD5UJ41_9FUNG|nr:hypothetical protein HK103_003096 [Boothiomyces macroporosus]
MGIQDEPTCIATPGFAGFVPSMSSKFGMTFGNASREILKTDPSLKKGAIQTELAKKTCKADAENTDSKIPYKEQKYVWDRKTTYATGDDRFSFPPVPGYTGYIPRSQDHFGRPFVEATNASLKDFQRMLRSKNTLPPKVLAIQSQRRNKKESEQAAPAETKPSHITCFDPYAQSVIDELSPYRLPAGHPQKTFISGYTGFPYSCIVREAIEDFGQTPPPVNPYENPKRFQHREPKRLTTDPIPGFTGFIPGAKTSYSMSFGKTAEHAYDQFNNRDPKG